LANHRSVLVAFIGDENASALPPYRKSEGTRMEKRTFKKSTPLNQRLEEQAKRLRKEAKGIPPGVEREKLIRQARQAETTARIQEWLTSPGSQAPR
jgi:hypothetical protein